MKRTEKKEDDIHKQGNNRMKSNKLMVAAIMIVSRRNAVKFDMDSYDDENDLVNRSPEANKEI